MCQGVFAAQVPAGACPEAHVPCRFRERPRGLTAGDGAQSGAALRPLFLAGRPLAGDPSFCTSIAFSMQ